MRLRRLRSLRELVDLAKSVLQYQDVEIRIRTTPQPGRLYPLTHVELRFGDVEASINVNDGTNVVEYLKNHGLDIDVQFQQMGYLRGHLKRG